MKYIRTEDGRIVNKNKTICYAFREDYISPNWNDDIEKYLETKIVAEADTIEELFDELVIHNPNNDGEFHRKTFVYENRWETILNEEYAQFCTNHYKQKVEIYGAIWTDKGLIYKAKMKGVLPNGEIDWELL